MSAKLVTTLKYVLYGFLGLYVLSLIMNPFILYREYSNQDQLTTQIIKGILTTILYGVTGIIVCFHGARVLNSFKKQTVHFKKMSNSFKWIAWTIMIGVIMYTVITYFTSDCINPEYWIQTIGNIMTIGLIGFFFLAISQIIKKADYYKQENDLTI